MDLVINSLKNNSLPIWSLTIITHSYNTILWFNASQGEIGNELLKHNCMLCFYLVGGLSEKMIFSHFHIQHISFHNNSHCNDSGWMIFIVNTLESTLQIWCLIYYYFNESRYLQNTDICFCSLQVISSMVAVDQIDF